MQTDTELLLQEYKTEYQNYKNFLDNNDWFNDVFLNKNGTKLESPKLTTEVSIIDTIIKSTNKFKDDVDQDIDKKPVKDFIRFTSGIINQHIQRIQEYKKLYPITADSLESDVEFHSDLFALITKTKVALSKLQIDEEELSKKSVDIFHGNQKSPLLMREFLTDTFPAIREKTENVQLDFYAPSINPATSNEMFVNMKPRDIPKWDVSKHFFEQELSTLQFWEEERRKMTQGINVYGYQLSPWLYFDLNHFKLAYINDDGKKVITQPQLRDNEYYFDEMYRKAREHGRCGLLMYGTRRYGKSRLISSHALHSMYTIPKCQATIQGFSEKPDLFAIYSYIADAIENMDHALRMPATAINMDGISLGMKGKKAQDRYDFSNLNFINLEGGNTKKGTQKTAGATPDVFVVDEISKGKILDPWKAAIPSFAGGARGKWRVTPLLAATAGNAELSKDAELMLKNPEVYSIMPMNWDILDSMVDPDYITWHRAKFGMFVPAQLSLEAPPKIKKPLVEFLGKEPKKGDPKIDIYATDWEASKIFFEEERKKKSHDMQMLASYTNSFPLEVEDCYLTTEVNKFPGLEAKQRRSFIDREGLTGQKYRLNRDARGSYTAEMVPDDPIILDYPYKGGNIDAPIVMLENPLLQPETPPLGLYVIGLDDVKQDSTSGDSVISATVFKRSYEGGEWANRIVAWYDSRPDKKKTYYKQLYYLMKIYNARLLYENEDNGFIEYVETNHMEDVHVHFSTGVGLASEENLHRNQNRKFGWSPTGQNIYLAEQKVVMYTKEDGVIIGDETGLSGIDRINHPMLLEELYKYKKGQNADRLRSFSLALTLARYYDNTYQYMKTRKANRHLEDGSYQKKNKFRRESQGLIFDSRLI